MSSSVVENCFHIDAKRKREGNYCPVSWGEENFWLRLRRIVMIRKRQLITFGALTLVLCALLIAARQAQAQTEKVLHSFCPPGCADGANPMSDLTFDGVGNLYGTTLDGGVKNYGTVFELSPNGKGRWKETVIYSFCQNIGCPDGKNPTSNLILDRLGNLYGTASLGGGGNDQGTIFELSPGPEGWTETTLYGFAGGADGANPMNGLIMDPTGNLYGTTFGGGKNGNGTVFELSPSGGGWAKHVIYNLGKIGRPYGLTMDVARNIFGVANSAVFELSLNGNGTWKPTVIHRFTGAPKDGSSAQGTPVLDKAGNVYGTTGTGGEENDGTVYMLTPVAGRKTWKKKILYSFKGGPTDGSGPAAGIVFDSAGNIYGTTSAGGSSSACSFGCGIVFELVALTIGKGSYTEKALWNFNKRDGQWPFGSLTLDSAGNLYGTTDFGGSQGEGVVFKVTP